jgi:hypothetical protein
VNCACVVASMCLGNGLESKIVEFMMRSLLCINTIENLNLAPLILETLLSTVSHAVKSGLLADATGLWNSIVTRLVMGSNQLIRGVVVRYTPVFASVLSITGDDLYLRYFCCLCSSLGSLLWMIPNCYKNLQRR